MDLSTKLLICRKTGSRTILHPYFPNFSSVTTTPNNKTSFVVLKNELLVFGVTGPRSGKVDMSLVYQGSPPILVPVRSDPRSGSPG